jgi:nicotinate-nucleotide adenylyltransferase
MGTLPFGPLKRFAVFGGSFDPVHVGHLSVAQQVLNALHLEKVILLPAATPPHKRDGRELAPAADRLAMCELAVFNLHGLEASDFELRKTGVSYTVETARILREAYGPLAQIHFLIGSDCLAELEHWYEVHELLGLLDFAIAERRDAPLKDSLWRDVQAALGADAEARLRRGIVPVEHVDVSSTLVRQLLRRGERIPGYLRRDVEDYIRSKGLYGAPPVPTRGGHFSGTWE